MSQQQQEEHRVEATSLVSFEDAINQAFDQVPGDSNGEGLASAEVAHMSLSKGGVVGRTQYHVVLVSPATSPGDY